MGAATVYWRVDLWVGWMVHKTVGQTVAETVLLLDVYLGNMKDD